MEEDVAECSTEVTEECADETSGYTTSTKCSKIPRNICKIVKKTAKKYTPLTGCNKEPRELCAPAGCGFVKVNVSKHQFIFIFICVRALKSVTTRQRPLSRTFPRRNATWSLRGPATT